MTRALSDANEIARLEDVANCWRQGCIEARAEIEWLRAALAEYANGNESGERVKKLK